MHIFYLIVYKCFLIKTAQPKLVGKIKERTRGLISRLNNCIAIDRFRLAYYSQIALREYAQHVDHSLIDGSHSLVFVSWSLLVCYEHVLGSFQFAFRLLCLALFVCLI